MRRLRSLCLAALLVGTAACAESGAESLDTTASTSVSGAVESSSTTPAGDFGSRYVGSPVAFWFWAPY